MWILTIRSPDGEPKEYILKPGMNSIGRQMSNDIFIEDTSASRVHGEINYNPDTNIVAIRDLDSTNGTFLNRQQLNDSAILRPNDIIRIGTCMMNVLHYDVLEPKAKAREMGTRPLTRELVLESYDQNSVLMYEVARQLNTIIDIDMALTRVSELMKQAMGADKCDVILEEKFDQLHEFGFPVSIAHLAIEQKTAVIIPDMMEEDDKSLKESASLFRIRSALCVPVISKEDLVGLIYMYKTTPEARPFDTQDMQLAVAISHLAALTIERVRLIERFREEQTVRKLLQRFVAPAEVEDLWRDYLQNGRLPGLVERNITILFTDIEDSTPLAERIGIQRFGILLANYYETITNIIHSHGGLVNKYLGDGVMALFGMGETDKNPVSNAIRAGMEVRAAIENLEHPEEEKYKIGIGINTGSVVAGYIGAKDRVEFTVLGDTVNVASRLEGLSKPNRIFISPSTRAAIGGEFETVRIGEMEIRGRSHPIQVYQVVD